MDSSLCFLVFILIIFSCFSNSPSAASSAPTQTLCHEKESFALLKFKQSLTINESVSIDLSAHNKVASWNLGKKSSEDCCSWDGIECDKSTGHVIAIDLSSSFLFGSINSSSTLFALTHLQKLNLADNNFNYSYIPSEIRSLSLLKNLNLSESAFLGPIPQEISQLSKLVSLDISYNGDSSSSSRVLTLKKTTLRSLFQNLTHLEKLALDGVKISSELPDTIANLSSLKRLGLSGCYFSGSIPASIGDLSHLTYLDLSDNDFSGQIPSLAGLSKLSTLYLSQNNLLNVGDLVWLGNLTKLTVLFLFGVDLSGSILSTPNNLSSDLCPSTSLPKFKILFLSNCNLKAFPDFLHYQDELEILILDSNKIHGPIPSWITNLSRESLGFLSLAYNFLTGFEQHHRTLPWSNLTVLIIEENMMQGQLPIPPLSIIDYSASNNNFTGQIPSSFCRLRFLQILDVDKNNLTGTIPPCLSNFSDSLSILKLGGNNLHGPIPQPFKEGNKLKIINLSNNQLQGKVPRSLENCILLRSLDLSSNLIEDVFPFWLGTLEKLQLLLLGSNKLFGAIRFRKSEVNVFPNLRIFDLSHNNFTGHLPRKYFQDWNAMKSSVTEQDEYMIEKIEGQVNGRVWFIYIPYAMTITNKGVNTHYVEISSIFTAIDLSSNKFEGEIPKLVGNLKALELFNVSNNWLSGEIPSSLGNLSNLESLDISQNKLSGKIPQQLTELNFLSVLNVSYNNLTGPIPKGKQFDTFQNDSYEGNFGVCGDPLSRKCGDEMTSLPPSFELEGADNDEVFPSGMDWIMIGLGYGSGLFAGMVIGQKLIAKYQL